MRGLGKGGHTEPADLAGMLKSVPRAWNVSLPGALTACAEHTALFVNLFSCSGFDVYFFVLLQACAYGIWTTPLLCLFLVGREGGPLPVSQRGVCRPVSAAGWDALAVGHPRSLSRLIWLCLFSVWVLFHPASVGVMFFSATHATCKPCSGLTFWDSGSW